MLLAKRNNIFDEMFRDPFFDRPFEEISDRIMRTDVHEKDENYIIEMELPGYSKEDVAVDLKDGYLCISATKDESKEEKDKKGNYIRRERYTGNCNRSFYVGNSVTREDIKASFKDGVLTLVVPKETPKAIEVKTRIEIE